MVEKCVISVCTHLEVQVYAQLALPWFHFYTHTWMRWQKFIDELTKFGNELTKFGYAKNKNTNMRVNSFDSSHEFSHANVPKNSKWGLWGENTALFKTPYLPSRLAVWNFDAMSQVVSLDWKKNCLIDNILYKSNRREVRILWNKCN